MNKNQNIKEYYSLEISEHEYDNYNYRAADEMTLTEQIESAEETLTVALRLSQEKGISFKRSEYLNKKIIEIKQRLKYLKEKKLLSEI